MHSQTMKKLLAGAGIGAVAVPSYAALPAEATAVFTSLSGTVSDVAAAAWPIIGAVMVLFLTIKLVKRAGNRV